MRNTTVAVLLFSALLSPVLPQTNTKLESHCASGPCKEICLNDHYAFAAFGGTLAAIDLATNTLTASLNLQKSVNYLALHQQTLYAAVANTGLYAIDITDVRSLRASLCSSDQVGKLILRDQRLFAAGNKSIRVYDIHTPMTAALLGSLTVPEYTFDIAVWGDYLYYAAYNAGIGVVDIRTPAAPVKIKTVPTSKNAYCIAECGGALYVGFNYDKGADIFSLAAPANPERVNSLSERYFCDMEDVGNTLFVAARDFGAFSLDITDPLHPANVIDYDDGNMQRLSSNGKIIGFADLLSGVRLYDLDAQQHLRAPYTYDIDILTLTMYSHQTTLYVSDRERGLKILDCSDPKNIRDHGFAKINASDIAFANDVACMARGSVAEFWSAADPRTLTKISTITLPDFRDRVFIHRGYGIFYSGSVQTGIHHGVTILDVQNPAKAKVLSNISFAGPVQATASGQLLFVIDKNKQLHTVDINDVSHPVTSTTPMVADSVKGFWTRQNTGYCTTSKDTLIIFDLSDPLQPRQKSKIHSAQLIREPLFYGVHAYSNGFLGMEVIDLSDPWAPRKIGFVSIPGAFTCPAIMGDNLVMLKVIYENKIAFYNLSTPNKPQALGCISLAGSSSAIAACGHHAFVANNAGGLKVLDLSLQQDQEIASIIARDDVVGVAVQEPYAYLAVTAGGLYVIDVSRPAQPSIVGHYYPSTNSNLSGVLVSGRYAYLIGGVYHLSVIDVSIAEQPQLVGKTSTSYVTGGADIVGGFLYLADMNKGMKIYDVRDPQNPKLAGQAALKGSAQDVCLMGHYAYVSVAFGASNPSAIHLFDVSEPTSPVKLDSVLIPSADFRGLARSGDYLIAAASSRGAYLLDLTNPLKPVNAGQFYTPGNNLLDVAVSGSHIFCCDAENGVYRVSSNLLTRVQPRQAALPQVCSLEQNYPNPFNPETFIRYVVSKSVHVKLEIYNALGELVCAITDEPHEPGFYIARWQGQTNTGQATATGLYFVRLQAGDEQLVKKMLLVR